MMIRSVFLLVAVAMLGVAHGKRGVGFPPSVWPKPQSMKCDAATQTLPPGATLVLNTSIATSNYAKGPLELAELFNGQIIDAIFDHKTAAASAAPIPVAVAIASYEQALALETDESYTLEFDHIYKGFKITAKTQLGAIHAFETLSQLIYFDFEASLYTLPKSCTITDTPRFQHRGLMIDTGRHYQPIRQIEKTLRAMRQNKLSVLHWHLVEIQSFPIRSQVFPELSKTGAWSELEKYTLEDMAYIVDYARKQGIRVVPELDQPGHTAAMWFSHPELFACQPANPYDMGSFGIALNPLDENVYTFMNKLVGELLTIFPDQFFHIGTDEVPEACWANITKDPNAIFQTYIDRATKNLTAGDFPTKQPPRKVIMWDEAILKAEPADKANTIIQVWHQAELIKNASDRGYKVIASPSVGPNNWYLDHLSQKWSDEYAWDPVVAGVDEENVLGGEGCMWGETVDVSDFDSTVWPRMSAIGERLWSVRADTQNLEDAQERLSKFRCLMVLRGVGATSIGKGGRPYPSGPGSCFTRFSNITKI